MISRRDNMDQCIEAWFHYNSYGYDVIADYNLHDMATVEEDICDLLFFNMYFIDTNIMIEVESFH